MTQPLPPRDSATSGTEPAKDEEGGSRLQGAELMSTALRLNPTPSPSAVRRLASDYQDVQRRLAALSRIASRLPRLTSEVELLTEVVDSLLTYFDRTRLVEVFVADGDWSESRLYCRERGGALQTTQCGGIEALPEAYRADFAVPRLMAGDGMRGPMMSAPVLEGVTLLGLVVVEAEQGAEDFTEEDHDALAGVAAQISMAIQQLRTATRQRRSQRMQRDLEAARRIQRSFLPALPTSVNGFRVATEYRPAYDVGGDVAGKGVAGALMMSRISSEIRRLVGGGNLAPREILTHLNESFSALGVD